MRITARLLEEATAIWNQQVARNAGKPKDSTSWTSALRLPGKPTQNASSIISRHVILSTPATSALTKSDFIDLLPEPVVALLPEDRRPPYTDFFSVLHRRQSTLMPFYPYRYTLTFKDPFFAKIFLQKALPAWTERYAGSFRLGTANPTTGAEYHTLTQGVAWRRDFAAPRADEEWLLVTLCWNKQHSVSSEYFVARLEKAAEVLEVRAIRAVGGGFYFGAERSWAVRVRKRDVAAVMREWNGRNANMMNKGIYRYVTERLL